MTPVSIDQFLIKSTPVEIIADDGNTLTVYIRNLRQIERDLCQAGARKNSRDLRKLLENRSTEEYELLIAGEIEEYDEDTLRKVWVNSRLVNRALQINRKSLEDRDQTYVPEPEDAATEADWERYENEVDEVEEQREESVNKSIKTAQRQLEEEVAKVPTDKLRDEVIPGLIDNLCQQAWTQEYAIQMVARGTFNDADCTQLTFRNSHDVRQLKMPTLEKLVNSHYGLLIEPEAVKPSRDEEPASASSRRQTSPTSRSSRTTKARRTGRGKSRSSSPKLVES